MNRNIAPALFAAALLLALVGCASVPDPASIPAEMSVPELSLNAQLALDKNNYRAAEVYYQIIIDRYGTDMAARTAAEFEIAHLRVKKEDWTEAKPRLEAIIERYESTGGAGLPPEYLVLARNDLAKIPVTPAK
jgi:outer membrane protein assembly factor BamD (BamD/ComL family)